MPYVHSWAEDGSTLLCFDTVALAPPAGRSRDHRTTGPGRRGSPPQWRHAGGALRSPVWGNLKRPGIFFSVDDRAASMTKHCACSSFKFGFCEVSFTSTENAAEVDFDSAHHPAEEVWPGEDVPPVAHVGGWAAAGQDLNLQKRGGDYQWSLGQGLTCRHTSTVFV